LLAKCAISIRHQNAKPGEVSLHFLHSAEALEDYVKTPQASKEESRRMLFITGWRRFVLTIYPRNADARFLARCADK
jgi:hypothetical protein